jgi:RND family efflux transporter MFP subunit
MQTLSVKLQSPMTMKNRPINYTIILWNTLVILLIAAACTSKPSEREKLNMANITSVKVAMPETVYDRKNIVASGLLTTADEARMAFKIGGLIDKIAVDEGDLVQKGQFLAGLNLVEINAQLNQAKLGLEKTKRDFDRAGRLYKDSVVTLEQLENAKTAFEIAQKSVDLLAFNQQYATIRAPYAGYISKKLANSGEVVGAGSPILFLNIAGATSGWVLKVGLSDQQWSKVEMGQKATVKLDAFPNNTYAAQITKLNQSSDPRTGLFEVELTLQDQPKTLAIGMFGKAEIDAKEGEALLSIPYEALIEANGMSASVFIADGATKVKRKSINIYSFDKNKVVIADGIASSDQIVISNTAFLNDRSTISIVK